MSNCILWNNGDDLYNCNATYSCIQDGDSGTGNIFSDPRFVDNDFHIDIHSPCVDAGDPNGDYDGQTDIDGDMRKFGTRVDMGADETDFPDAHWWKLDETSGTTAYDSIDTNNGTFNGNDPCWVNGLIGGAVDCNGASDYFSVSSLDGDYNSADIFSVAGWFKTTKTTGKQTIVGQWAQYNPLGAPPPLYWGWQVLVENKKVVARFGNGSATADITGTTDANDGNWHHFVLVYPTSNSNAILYVDSNSEGTPAARTFATGPTKFRIGDGSYEWPNGEPMTRQGGPFCGTIDDVMIYHRVLTADEVRQIYHSIPLPAQASAPSPANLATDVNVTNDLSWTAGEGAASHDVYFGTVSPPPFQVNQTSATFDPGTLRYSTDYYWRIDERNAAGVTTGNIWSFTTTVDPNLVGWWKLDETSGTTAYDSIDDNDGAFNGNDPCWVTGLIGGAIDCNGVSDYFSVSTLDGAYTSSSTFSVAGWFKTTQTTGKQTIVGQWAQFNPSGYPPPVYWGWQVLVENKKVVSRFGNGSATASITGTTDVNDGNWHHFALVYPTSSFNATLYVDSNSEGTPAARTFATGPTKFRIGDGSYEWPNGEPMTRQGGPFCGTIDDIMLFERALSADEVEQLFNSGS